MHLCLLQSNWMSDLTRKKLLLFVAGRQAGKQINKKYISTYGETTIYIEQQEWLRPMREFLFKQFGVTREFSLRYQLLLLWAWEQKASSCCTNLEQFVADIGPIEVFWVAVYLVIVGDLGKDVS